MVEEKTGAVAPLESGARVRRKKGKGSMGTVKEIRTEVTAAGSNDPAEKGLMVIVDWDNGTQSYFTPNSLEVVAKK
ncbi:MAG: hypothetical protein KDD70_10500 [Bdellovibrionales bacterium]|nr:hypothetical protein [Bdellovibrionales bacterium]